MPKPEEIANQLLDQKTSLNVDGLLDAVIALYNDCNFPVLKRIRNIDAFIKRNQPTITHLENSRLKGTDFNLIKVIGRGAFGEVRLVRHHDSRRVYAMKLLDKNEMLRRADTAFFWEERDIMAHAESEWLVRLHYAFQDKTHLYMVMEFMPGGDVVNLMSNYEINEEWARFYVAELVLALDAIHSMGYIHRDVKPDNMLVSSTGHIKLADFGTCVKMGEDGLVRCSSAVGTPDYISPEMLQQQGVEGVYGRELDWWSVGIFLYELIVGETPFYADSIANTYARIMNFSSNLFFPEDVPMSDVAKDLIKKFLSDAKIRLGKNGIHEVKNHPFFKNDKWTFDTITKATPPYVPTLNGDDDTSHFEDVDEKEANIADGFQIPKAFTGNQLPFIGFTYSNELGPIGALKNSLNSMQVPSSTVSTSQQNNLTLEKQRLEEALKNVQSELITVQHQLEMEKQQKDLKLDQFKRTSAVSELQVNDLKAENNRLEEVLKTLRTELSTMERQFETEKLQSEHKIEQIRSSESIAESQLSDLKNENHRLEEALRAVQNELMTVQHQFESEKRQSELKSEQIKELEKVISTGQSQDDVQSKTKELSIINEALQLNQTEIGRLRAEKSRLDGELNSLLMTKRTHEQKVNELNDKLKMEQNMVRAFKSELKAREDDYAKRQKMVQEIEMLKKGMDSLSNLLHSEQLARRISEQNTDTLDSENRTLQATLSQSVERYTREMQAKNTTIAHLTDREAELTEINNKLEHEIQDLEQKLKQKTEISQHEVRRTTGSSNSGNELENLSRDQLIQRVQREMTLKKEAIEKLLTLGHLKGIADDKNLPSKPSKKNKNDTKRIREQVAIEMHQEREKYQKEMAVLQDNFNFMQKTLYDEQMKREDLEVELRDLRIFAEEVKNRNYSEVDTQSLDSRSADASLPFPQFICNGNFQVKQSAGAFGNKRKKMNWEPMHLQLTEKALTFFKHNNKGPCILVIAVEMLFFVRKVSEADLRSENKKNLPLILQIFYDSKSNKLPSRRGSTIDLSSSFSNASDSLRNISTSNSALNYAGGDDVSLAESMNTVARGNTKKLHDFIEVSYYMPTSCDFCKRQISHLFKHLVGLECKKCHLKFHKEHLEKNEIPPCKCTFEAASELYIKAEKEDITNFWFGKMSKLISTQASVKRANSIIDSRHGAGTPTSITLPHNRGYNHGV